MLLPATAQAQVSGSALLESDYRFRGVSLSGEHADVHLGVAYDHPSGWYAGASATTVQIEAEQRDAQLLGYLGYARRGSPGLGWEVGAVASHFDGVSHYDYAEAYAGLLGQRWNARLYGSPDYFGRGVRTAYAELNGAWPLAPAVQLFGHAGALLRLSGPAPPGAQRRRYDARIGLGVAIGSGELQLAWTGTTRGGPYPASYEHRRSAVVLSLAYYF